MGLSQTGCSYLEAESSDAAAPLADHDRVAAGCHRHEVDHRRRLRCARPRVDHACELVLEAFENPNRHRPGHIAIIRPSEKTRVALDREGPQETQAGETNAISTTTAAGFRHHRGAWSSDGTGGLHYYAHAVTWP